MNKKFLVIFHTAVYIFAAIGFVLTGGYFAVKWGWTNTSGIIDLQREGFYSGGNGVKNASSTAVWAKTEEWAVFKEAVVKDKDIIDRASKAADVGPRLIFSNLAVEQLRLFFTTREVYKQIFAPLKILGVQSQFSWGVMGVKPETAIQIENNLKDPASPFYPGAKYEHLLDFSTTDIAKERFERMTDQHARYYSYLYGALYLKELESQWKKAGYDISERTDILSTLYNIGFQNSKPNPEPKVGGAEIEVNGTIYSFGGLSAEIYDSSELTDIFPKQ